MQIYDSITITVVDVTDEYVQLDVERRQQVIEDNEEDWRNPAIDYDMYLQD
jgi:sRNA-binding carbon storage regulator CsrA